MGNNPLPYYIGVMSGTSLDAIDMVVVCFEPFQLIATHTCVFPERLKAQLAALMQPDANEIDRMGQACIAYAQCVAEGIHQLLAQAALQPTDIVAIGCHGQTIRHRPEWGFTLQIGDPHIIAEQCQIDVVADFRRRDMAAGGQGAPLVPAFHAALFQHAHTTRVILNLGGIANISVLPPLSEQKPVIGFDTGPANLLLDGWIQQHLQQPFDADGQWARQGSIHTPLLNALLQHPYFTQPYPKSTGRELFHLGWLMPYLAQYPHVQPEDVQATLVELTAASVAQGIALTATPAGELWVCGGGAYNTFLLERIHAHLPQFSVQTTSAMGLAPTWVEAVAFAWLAMRHVTQQAGNLPEVTGAKGERILGAFFPKG